MLPAVAARVPSYRGTETVPRTHATPPLSEDPFMRKFIAGFIFACALILLSDEGKGRRTARGARRS
jgi:hypothetical protein